MQRVNFLIDEKQRDDFMLFCRLKGNTISDELRDYISRCLNENVNFLDTVKIERQKILTNGQGADRK